MDQEKFIHDVYSVTKSLFNAVKLQQEDIQNLSKSHYALQDALRAECGLEQSAPPRESAELEKAESGLAELERMFDPKDDEGEKP